MKITLGRKTRKVSRDTNHNQLSNNKYKKLNWDIMHHAQYYRCYITKLSRECHIIDIYGGNDFGFIGLKTIFLQMVNNTKKLTHKTIIL